MSLGKLIFHNKSSTDFGAWINYPMVQATTKRNVSLSPVVGVNGSYINDNLNYTDVTQQISFFVERPLRYKDWFTWGMDFGDWLTSKDKFVEYEPFYFEPFDGWHWEAFLSDGPNVTPQNEQIATVNVTISAKPFLISNDSVEYQIVPKTSIYNWQQYAALPIFHIVGDGDFTLTVNGKDYQFNDIDEELYVDCERCLIYKSLNENRNSHALLYNHEFPKLDPGKNLISLKGNYTKFEYQPRWRRALV